MLFCDLRKSICCSERQKDPAGEDIRRDLRLSKKVSQNILKNQMRRRVRRICIFPERKWRGNNTFSQEIARKILEGGLQPD